MKRQGKEPNNLCFLHFDLVHFGFDDAPAQRFPKHLTFCTRNGNMDEDQYAILA